MILCYACFSFELGEMICLKGIETHKLVEPFEHDIFLGEMVKSMELLLAGSMGETVFLNLFHPTRGIPPQKTNLT